MAPRGPSGHASIQNIIRSNTTEKARCFKSCRNADSDEGSLQDRSSFFESGRLALWMSERVTIRCGPETHFGMNFKNTGLKIGNHNSIDLGDLVEDGETLAREPFGRQLAGKLRCFGVR